MVTWPMTSRDPRGQTRDPVKHKASRAMGLIPRSTERISSYLKKTIASPSYIIHHCYSTHNAQLKKRSI